MSKKRKREAERFDAIKKDMVGFVGILNAEVNCCKESLNGLVLENAAIMEAQKRLIEQINKLDREYHKLRVRLEEVERRRLYPYVN